MNRPGDFFPAIALALMVGLASVPLAAQVGSPPAKPGSGSSPWNSSTTPPPARPPATDGALSFRIYNDLNEKGLPPYRHGPRHDDPGYAVDVSAVMTRCADGSLVITALVIGGQLTPLDNRCPAERPSGPAEAAPACDANRWNCSTAGPKPAN